MPIEIKKLVEAKVHLECTACGIKHSLDPLLPTDSSFETDVVAIIPVMGMAGFHICTEQPFEGQLFCAKCLKDILGGKA
jgi:hypothetical protein